MLMREEGELHREAAEHYSEKPVGSKVAPRHM